MHRRIRIWFTPRALVFVAAGLVGTGSLAPRLAGAQASPSPAPIPGTTTVSGTVDFFMLGLRGEVNGLLLKDNTVVRFAPQLEQELVRNVRPGDVISATGTFVSAGQIRASSIRDLTSQKTISEIPPATPATERQMLETTGTVRLVTRGPQGQVDGVILTNGIAVHVPAEAAARLAALLQPGQPFAARGWGTINEYGRTIDADSVGPSLDKLYSVHPGP
jgi:hypothetical protein